MTDTRKKRVGILCLPGVGHLNPATSLGRCLQQRGHHVVMFQVPIAKARVKVAGLAYRSIACDAVDSTLALSTAGSRLGTLQVMSDHARRVLMVAPDAFRQENIEAVVADQADLASSSVAENLRLPFVALSPNLPLYLDASVPPCTFGWAFSDSGIARVRYRAGNALLSTLLQPIVDLVNAFRSPLRLRPFRGAKDIISGVTTVTQLPEDLEFPVRPALSNFHYPGPFGKGAEYQVEFPWHRLDRRPLVYASMGTVVNNDAEVFRTIASACAALDVQLVLSLGGRLRPEDLGSLQGDPIVVHYAPQRELLSRASAAIAHGGLNTALEALERGVPMVSIPVNSDQPGVAARVAWVGAGLSLPYRRVTESRLRASLSRVLRETRYKQAAERMQMAIRSTGGVEMAADIVERVI